MERSKVIFGNEIAAKDYRKAVKSREKFLKKYGDDSQKEYRFRAVDNPVIGEPLGVKNLVLTDSEPIVFPENALIVGNIRMGYGHYRISMAIASAANALGFVPYWLEEAKHESELGALVDLTCRTRIFDMLSLATHIADAFPA